MKFKDLVTMINQATNRKMMLCDIRNKKNVLWDGDKHLDDTGRYLDEEVLEFKYNVKQNKLTVKLNFEEFDY